MRRLIMWCGVLVFFTAAAFAQGGEASSAAASFSESLRQAATQRVPSVSGLSDALLKARVLDLLDAHPDQDAVKRLRDDIASNELPLIGGPINVMQPRYNEKVAYAALGIYLFTHTLFVPDYFFAVDACSRQAVVQGVGLFYARTHAAKADIASLILAAFFVSDTDLANRQRVLAKLDALEGAVGSDIDRFANVLFKACSQATIGMLSENNVPATSQAEWSDEVKMILHEMLSDLRGELARQP